MRRKLCNVEQRRFLKCIGVNPKDFLFGNEDFESYTFIHKKTGKIGYFRRYKCKSVLIMNQNKKQ